MQLSSQAKVDVKALQYELLIAPNLSGLKQ